MQTHATLTHIRLMICDAAAPCCQPLVELLNSKNSKSESAQRHTRHMHRSGNCRVLLQTVWFDWRRLEVNSKKANCESNFDLDFSRSGSACTLCCAAFANRNWLCRTKRTRCLAVPTCLETPSLPSNKCPSLSVDSLSPSVCVCVCV